MYTTAMSDSAMMSQSSSRLASGRHWQAERRKP
jgi:hypothetical protein